MNIKKANDLPCRQVKYLVTLYPDNEPDSETADAVKNHLDGCQTCKEELYGMQRITQQIRDLPEVDVPGNFPAVVMSAININTKKYRSWGWINAPAFVYSFVFILFLFIGFFMSQNLGTQYYTNTSSIQSDPTRFQFTVAQVFKDSQDVRLISIQEDAMSLLSGNGTNGEAHE